jgi:hypothetical protein
VLRASPGLRRHYRDSKTIAPMIRAGTKRAIGYLRARHHGLECLGSTRGASSLPWRRFAGRRNEACGPQTCFSAESGDSTRPSIRSPSESIARESRPKPAQEAGFHRNGAIRTRPSDLLAPTIHDQLEPLRSMPRSALSQRSTRHKASGVLGMESRSFWGRRGELLGPDPDRSRGANPLVERVLCRWS